jgi:hypothetical protein
MSLLAFAVVLAALRLVYVAPMAITQDIVAARQVLKGEPLPTTDIQPLVGQALAAEEHPAPLESVCPRLAAACPGLARQEREEYDDVARLIQEQAHPPFATLFVVPFVYFLGVYDSSLAISFLSIASVGVTLLLLYRGLSLDLSASQKVLFCSVFLGWYPMFGVLRSGQWGAFLGMLVVAGWYCIRRGRPALGGVAVGVAASLKAFPALLLVYFLLRHRRACWAGVATIIVVNVTTMAVFGPHSYVDYVHTARLVTEKWGGDHQNWSLLGALHHLADIFGAPAPAARAAFMAAALVLVAAICLPALAARRSRPPTAVEYSLFVVAMTFLSPTCWSHYFVVLLLPLVVLANHTKGEGALSSWMFLGLFLAVAVPDAYAKVLRPFVEPYVGPRAGTALLLFPSLALLGMMLWLANLARTSSGVCDGAKPKVSAEGLA